MLLITKLLLKLSFIFTNNTSFIALPYSPSLFTFFHYRAVAFYFQSFLFPSLRLPSSFRPHCFFTTTKLLYCCPLNFHPSVSSYTCLFLSLLLRLGVQHCSTFAGVSKANAVFSYFFLYAWSALETKEVSVCAAATILHSQLQLLHSCHTASLSPF